MTTSTTSEAFVSSCDSPLGRLRLTSDGVALSGVDFEPDGAAAIDRNGEPAVPVLQKCVQQLRAYFDGRLTEFDLPLRLAGTEFQNRVWQELCRVPFGDTLSYSALAARIGNPKAVRAVGLANARNPIAVIVPCHRVIGANGSLTGYGGGLERKRWLLEHEGGMRSGGRGAEE